MSALAIANLQSVDLINKLPSDDSQGGPSYSDEDDHPGSTAMIFCPTCGNMLIVDKSEADGQHRFSCMTCPYDYPIAGKQYVETNYLQRKQADDVLGGEDSWKNVDSIEATCPKCDNRRAYFMQIQIRSADEPSTTFFRCTRSDCAYQWKEN